MFTFDILESHRQIIDNPLVELAEQKMRALCEMNLLLEDPKNILFVIAKEREKKVIGGACLLKKTLNHIQEDVRELIATLTFHNDHIWECSSIYFEPVLKNFIPGVLDQKDYFQSFYRELYEYLAEFGNKQDVPFLVMKLATDIYIATKEFGAWPYVVELKPNKSPDGLFHGILPLTGNQYETYQFNWK